MDSNQINKIVSNMILATIGCGIVRTIGKSSQLDNSTITRMVDKAMSKSYDKSKLILPHKE